MNGLPVSRIFSTPYPLAIGSGVTALRSARGFRVAETQPEHHVNQAAVLVVTQFESLPPFWLLEFWLLEYWVTPGPAFP